MDPMELDVDETVHSQSDTESDEDVDNSSDVELPEETKEDTKTGIYNTHHHPFPYFFMFFVEKSTYIKC